MYFDTKWKLLSDDSQGVSGISIIDIYQIYTCMHALDTTQEGWRVKGAALIYPLHEQLESPVLELKEAQGSGFVDTHIRAAFLDLSDLPESLHRGPA